MLAIIQKDHDTAKMILKNQHLLPNQQDHNGNTALIFAICTQDHEVINKLLEHEQLDINLQNNQGETALMMAIRVQDADTVNLLLAHGADASKKDRNLDTALTIAQKCKNPNMLKLVLDHANNQANSKNMLTQSRTVLHSEYSSNVGLESKKPTNQSEKNSQAKHSRTINSLPDDSNDVDTTEHPNKKAKH